MGKVVSSESDGWTPNPEVMAPRKFKLTKWGWFPEDDGFGPCKSGFADIISDSPGALKDQELGLKAAVDSDSCRRVISCVYSLSTHTTFLCCA